VDAERERVELKNQVFSPGKNLFDLQPWQPFDADFAVACDTFYFAAHERLQLLGSEVE
jgi:hypothetical protein